MSKLLSLGILSTALVFSGVAFAADDQATATNGNDQAAVATTPAVTADTKAPADKKAVAEKAPVVEVNLNEADAKTLLTVKGMTKKAADAIVEYRTKNGPFKSVDELSKVKGVSKKVCKKVSKHLTV